jgi:hypothetical protein
MATIINVCLSLLTFFLQTFRLDDTFCLCVCRKRNTSRRRHRTDLSEILVCKNIPLTIRHKISKNRICVSVVSSYYANSICDSMKSMSSL